MLLRVVPLLAIAIILIALIFSAFWRPYDRNGLNAPAHQYSGLF
ncbi:hypothetical protein [Sulfitobacter sp. EhC04]|nr:hypothetical protein [Sulfitobacter sp. EhC04]